jgi:hypothetical protein
VCVGDENRPTRWYYKMEFEIRTEVNIKQGPLDPVDSLPSPAHVCQPVGSITLSEKGAKNKIIPLKIAFDNKKRFDFDVISNFESSFQIFELRELL